MSRRPGLDGAQWPAHTTYYGYTTYYADTYMLKVVATDPERMWAEDADVLTAKLEPGFMLQGTIPSYHP